MTNRRLRAREWIAAGAMIAMIVWTACGATSTCAAEPPPSPLDERLGADVVPTHESVDLTLDPRTESYTGRVRIDLRVDRPTPHVRFHAREITFTQVTLRATSRPTPIPVETSVSSAGLVHATAARPLARGTYTLEIAFTARFGTQAAGLYRLKSGDDWYCFTQFEASDARAAFPCWDEPGYKIPWDVSLTVPVADSVVGNTPIAENTVHDAQRVVRFARTRPLPSYLIALATGPFEFVPVPGPSIPTRVVTVRGASDLAHEAVVTTPPLIAALERYFHRPYPYEKLDLLAVPEFWPGAMENPGAITFADRILLLDSHQADASARRRLASVTAHELAHMWFGDLVTMRWWDDLWLNESFASWMGDKVTHECFPALHVDVTALEGTQQALDTDAQLTTRAIRQPVEPGANLLQMADALAYDKGQAVLGMFEQYLGTETFRRGVLAYLEAHEWGNATADDLWRALSASSRRDVGGIMSTFLDQPGVPLVRVTPHSDGSVTLAQSRFLNYGLTAPSAQRWSIPVTLRYSTAGHVATKGVLLETDSMTVRLGEPGTIEWVHPNAEERGYYRWSLPAEGFTRLAATATTTLSVRERLGFLSNAEALLVAGRLDGATYAHIVERFGADSAPEVVSGVCSALDRLWSVFVTPDMRPAFAAYVERTLRPAVARFGLAPYAGEDEAVDLMRPSLWTALALYANDRDVQVRADSLTEVILTQSGAVSPSLVQAALFASAVRGDSTLFRRMREQFETSRAPMRRRQLLQALGAFAAPDRADEALRYALNGPLRANEVMSIPRGLGEWPEHGDRVLRWMMDNEPRLRARIPAEFSIFLPWFAGRCSTERLATVQEFFTHLSDVAPGTDIELRKLAAAVADCTGLRERESRAVIQAFTSPAAPPATAP